MYNVNNCHQKRDHMQASVVLYLGQVFTVTKTAVPNHPIACKVCCCLI